MDSNEVRLDALFAGAEAARTAELKRALRDPVCWAEQVVLAFVMGMKCFALTFVSASALLLAGADEQLALTLGVVSVLAVVPFNPRRFFWRMLFVERADRAFDGYLRAEQAAERR